jgi:hypothetical protein
VLLLYESEAVPDSLLQSVGPESIVRQLVTSPRTPREIAYTLSNPGEEWFVLGLDDYVCQFAAEMSNYSARRTMRASAAFETLNKHLLRIRWNTICTSNPMLYPVPFRFRRYSDMGFDRVVEECEDERFSETVPIILKPDALDASIGIRELDSWAVIRPAIRSLGAELAPLSQYVKSLGINIVPAITAEHQIPRSKILHPGAEFSAEFLSVRTRSSQASAHLLMGITQKYINPETFVEVAHCFPSPTFPERLRDTLVQVTSRLLDELGVEFCISHWEYIVTEDERIALVEAQLRPAGDFIMNLVSIATDSNPYRVFLDALKSKDGLPIGFSKKRLSAVFFPLPDREIRGAFSLVCQGEAAALCGKRLFIDDELPNARAWKRQAEWHSRYLAILTDGATFDEAKAKCQQILSEIFVTPQDSDENTDPIRLTLAL